MMSKHNEKVIEVLNRYVEMVPPHYAIMLNGEWGCGKTYFIKEKWLSQLTNTDTIKYSIINISLFGMTNIKELENSFIYNTFKVSATTDKTDVITKNLMKDNDLKDKLNKVMSKVANKKIGSLFEGATGIGMNDLVTIFAKNWLDDDEDGETKILILDDLERSKIEFEQIFGFISSYLESTGLRVIFISNDARIDEQGYKEKREKIIGETFKIEADINGAIESFLKETEWLLKPENSYLKKITKEIQFKLDINNLRIIRQTLLKLEYLMEIVKCEEAYKNYSYEEIEIDQKKYNKQYYLEMISYLFMIANMQKLKDDLDKDEIRGCFIAYFKYNISAELYNRKYEKRQEYIEKQKVSKREGSIGFMSFLTSFKLKLSELEGNDIYIPLIEEDSFIVWQEYIWDGYINKDKIHNAVKHDMEVLVPQEKSEKETLLKLMIGYLYYEEEEFYNLQSELLEELKEGQYINLDSLKASYYLLQYFDEKNILCKEIDIEKLFEEVYKVIGKKKPNETPKVYVEDELVSIDTMRYKRYEVPIPKDEESIALFLKRVHNVYKENTNIELKKEIKDIIEGILEKENSVDTLFNELTIRPHIDYNKQRFINVPVLDWLGIDELWNFLKQITLQEQRSFFSVLEKRYDLNELDIEEIFLIIKAEKEVISELVEKYEEEYEKAEEHRSNKVLIYEMIKYSAKKIHEDMQVKMKAKSDGNLESLVRF